MNVQITVASLMAAGVLAPAAAAAPLQPRDPGPAETCQLVVLSSRGSVSCLPHVFVCYTAAGGEAPQAFPADTVEAAVAGFAHHYAPVAVAGTVPFGTNLGGFHLVCDPNAHTEAGMIDGSGEVMPAATPAALGLYPLALP